MAKLFDFLKMTVAPDKLVAQVQVSAGVPLRTSGDVDATARVYYLAPQIADQVCLGDSGAKFRDCMGDTELPHLLEHLACEIMRQTGLAGRIVCGRTRQDPSDPRRFDVELICPDDVLAIGSLSSAAFMMDWAYLSPAAPKPDFDATVRALRELVQSLDEKDAAAATNAQDRSAPAASAVENGS